jgi:hypothetical protein
VTHPFHPLHGRSFELVTYRKTWGEDRVFFHEGGRLRALPADWTDAADAPVFVALAEGRAHFRPDDLLRLVELVGGLMPRRESKVSKRKPTAKAARGVSSKLRRKRKVKKAARSGLPRARAS